MSRNLRIRACDVDDYDGWYRILKTPGPVHDYMDLFPASYYVDEYSPEENPSKREVLDFLRSFGGRYDVESVCRAPDDNISGQRSYYLRPGVEFKPGGYEYPYNAPFCSESQYVRRVVLPILPDQTPPYPYTVYGQTGLSRMERDISDFETDRWESWLSEHESGIGYCQKLIPGEPERYALFRSFNRAPESVRECEYPQNDLDWISVMNFEINDELQKMFETRLDEQIAGMARDIAERVSASGGFIFSLEQTGVMRETISLALQYGVAEPEMISIADDLANMATDEEHFLTSFMIVMSLRVALYLNDQSVSRGGGSIHPKFSVVAREIETAIRTGRMKITVSNIDDQDPDYTLLKGAGLVGLYMEKQDELFVPPRQLGTSLLTLLDANNLVFGILVHECIHAYQDWLKDKSSLIDSEFEAYKTGYKVQELLLDDIYGPQDEIDLELFEEDKQMLDDMKFRTVIQGLRCMGYNEDFIESERQFREDKRRFMSEIFNEIRWELAGPAYETPYLKKIFIKSYTQKHAYNGARRNFNLTENTILKIFSESGSAASAYDELLERMRGQQRELAKNRRIYNATPSRNRKKAETAFRYFNNLGALWAYARYIDPQLLTGILDEYLAVFDRVANDLMKQVYERDGL